MPKRKTASSSSASSSSSSKASRTAKQPRVGHNLTDECKKHKVLLERKYQQPFRDEFFAVWRCAQRINSSEPLNAFAPALVLVGPFEALSGDFAIESADDDEIFTHCRRYWDTPEFLTVAETQTGSSHLALFRDDPKVLPCFVAQNEPAKSCEWRPVADSLIAAILTKKNVPAEARQALQQEAAKLGIDLSAKKLLVECKRRQKQRVNGPTFHKLGVSVPYDAENDVGYRHPTEGTKLKNLCKRMHSQKSSGKKVDGEALNQELTFVNYGNDEGDPGMGLQLGLDLFCSFEMFHSEGERLTRQAYDLMDRDLFAEIMEAHAADRGDWPL